MGLNHVDAVGCTGELLVAAEFIRRSIPVYQPMVDSGADLVVDIGGRLQRIQVKSTESKSRRVSVHLMRRGPSGQKGRRHWVRYAQGDLDWYAICCFGHDYIALIPADRAGTTITFDRETCGDRLDEIEIGAVIDRLMEENK